MFKEIFESSPIAKILVDHEGKIKLANRQATLLFDYSNEELVGQDISILIPTKFRQIHRSHIQGYIQAPLSRKMGMGKNLLGMRKDQSTFPIEVALSAIQSEDQLFILSSVVDISERARAEERFRAAINAAPNGMILLNRSGVILFLNKKVEEIFGYKVNELVQQPIEKLVPDSIRKGHPIFVKSYVKHPEPRAMGSGRELFGKHKTGKLIPVEIGLQPLLFENETFIISSVVDITRRKTAEKQAKEKSEEVQEFSYRTSHDLKSPLLTIGGLSDFIIDDIQDGDLESATSNVVKIKSLAKKLGKLVEDILTLTKIDLDQEPLEDFDFEEYFNNANEKFQHLIQETEASLQCSFNHQKPLQVQKIRFTQVLDNLVSNAMKYCNRELQTRWVKLSTSNDSKSFFIQVEDNGLGIPSEKHSEVFGMFKRFHEGEIDGTGLGLYMIKKHVEKLGSTIHFESSPSGTTFFLEIPFDR